MNDDTRKFLKVFGVAVTDAEAEAEKLAGIAAQLSVSSTKGARLYRGAVQGFSRELILVNFGTTTCRGPKQVAHRP